MTADHPTPAEPVDLEAVEARSRATYGPMAWRSAPRHLEAVEDSARDVPVLLAELARRDAALADLTRQRDEARAQVRVANALLADVDRDPTALAELYDRARRTVLRQRKLVQAAEAQLERQAPVIEAARAWRPLHGSQHEPCRPERCGQLTCALTRAVDALGPVDPEATADDPFDTGAPEHAPPPEAKEAPAGPTDLLAALRASLDRAKAARADATPAPLHVEDGNGGQR